MSAIAFIRRQLVQIRAQGRPALLRKLRKTARYAALAIPIGAFVAAIRIIRPWLLVRIAELSESIGHFSVDTEIHLCELDAGINLPQRRHLNLYFHNWGFVCNQQLATMWKRSLHIWPEWFLRPVLEINRLLPGAAAHEFRLTPNEDRDILNLLDRSPAHLHFTADEEARGRNGLRAMGIPPGAQHVCLIARDNAYNAAMYPEIDLGADNFRNSDIQNFRLAAQELTSRGYFVIRMGARVSEAMAVADPKFIDYATNGMRSDFMDIYLGATCAFCLGSATGYLGIPRVFRRPVAMVDTVPIGLLDSFWQDAISIAKRHFSVPDNRELTLGEILARGAGFCLKSCEFESNGVRLVANSPEEIRDVAIEMDERIHGSWQCGADDESLQKRFWTIFPTNALSAEDRVPLHGEIRGRYGAAFLRRNRNWLD